MLDYQVYKSKKLAKKYRTQNVPMYCITCHITDFTNSKSLLKVNILIEIINLTSI